MSHLMTALAMQITGLKPATKIVLYWLADCHNLETDECFPSVKTIAEKCEMSRRSVIAHLEELERLGIISKIKRTMPNGAQTRNSYLFNVSVWGAREAKPKTYKRKKKISKSLRFRVYERDQFCCVYCGSSKRLSCDHIHPESKGGKTTFDNLQTLCVFCNSKKGVKSGKHVRGNHG